MTLLTENPVLAVNLRVVLSRASGLDLSVHTLQKVALGAVVVHGGHDAKVTLLANGYHTHVLQFLSVCMTSVGV
jgi:hypothetical protein